MKKTIEIKDSQGITRASCCLWWGDGTPGHGDSRPGFIGAYDVRDDQSAADLLTKAEDQLRAEGCDTLIGPMDGDTWHAYRFVTESSDREPFFLEPQNPAAWPIQFQAAGFTELARYSSSELDLTPSAETEVLTKVEKRLADKGVTIREFDPSRFDEELQHIYEVSVASFSDNFLYTPISFSEFSVMYGKIRPLIVPALTILAESPDRCPAGFAFAYPDGETLIVKTLAVVPDRRLAGLGNLLVSRVHDAGRTAGFTSAIHALQHESNSSLKITSRHGAEKFRSYSLLVKKLS